MTRTFKALLIASVASCASIATPASAQAHNESRVEIAWNRYYEHDKIESYLKRLAEAYPDLIELRSIGKSLEGRDMWLAIVTSPDVKKGTEDHTNKPAMWIDGAIHANEIQATEVVLYSLWYLTKEYGHNDQLTELLDNTTFYMLPMVNPDSRAAWFSEPATPHYPRGNQRPVDDDGDGLFDEDPGNDLDGDGSITQMWKKDPGGRYIRDRKDPRIFTRVGPDEQGEWTYMGNEGIDDDGDGRLNEDWPGGDDMNRNWPADWKPGYIQRGAGPYPLSHPETNAIAQWCYAHPNIAAFQTYHNTGGMILRGPGSSYREGDYPGADRRVYDELGREGEKLLPFYRYLVIYKDLYNVHGGESTWASEALGVISFTNELFTAGKYFQRDGYENPSEEQMLTFRDRLQFGDVFTEYTEYDHPQLGEVLVGGLNKWSSRSTPTFMLEEECHRNFAFTMYHAGAMAKLGFERVEMSRAVPGTDLWQVDVEVRNSHVIPTRTARQAQKSIGTNDLLLCEPSAGTVVTSGSVRNFWDKQIEETRHEPGRVQLPRGVGSRGSVLHRFFIEAPKGTRVKLSYKAERAMDITKTVTLTEK